MKNLMEITLIPAGDIFRSATNPRKKFDRAKLEETKASIAESGLIQPLTVRAVGEGFELVAGERRFRCLQELGWGEIPCVVRLLSDADVATLQMAENMGRSDLSPMEECAGVSRMRDLGMDADEVARRLGVKARWVQGRLKLGELPRLAQRALESERLSMDSAHAILKVSKGERNQLVLELLESGEEMTTAQVLDFVRERYLGPKERREKWRAHAERLAVEWAGRANVLEDPETWAQYVQPYGKPVGKWRLGGEEIGSQAARRAEEGVTWGALAEAAGLPALLVPVAGVVCESFTNVVVLVDSAVVLAAEKAARKAKAAYTIGPRVRGGVGEEAREPGPEVPEVPGEFADSADSAGLPVGALELLRADDWSPWAVAGELDDEGFSRAMLALAVLDSCGVLVMPKICGILGAEEIEVRQAMQETEGIFPWVVWLLLRGSVHDPQLVRLAGGFGILDFWRERRAA
jgi:ParB family transcriptional regulator, chromosome partitioning protein